MSWFETLRQAWANRNGSVPDAAAIEARRTREPSAPDEGRASIGQLAAGIRVSPASSLRTATVWACHRYLTQTVAQLPVRVMRQRAGYAERVETHPVASVFTWRANPELSPFQLKETLVGWAIIHGNGVAEIERDAAGRVVALYPIHPDRIEYRRDVANGALIYRVSNGSGATVDLRPDEVFHIRGFGDGPVGLGVVAHAAETIGWAKATEIFGAAFFGNGMNAGGVIEGAGSLTEPGQNNLRKQIAKRHGGPRRAHTPLFLDKDMKWVQTSVAPDEGQFIETAQHQVEEICRWFGVPPQKVGHLLRMTFNNVEQLSIEVVVDSITPWAIRWEEEANYKLFGQNRPGFFIKLELKGLLRGAFKDRQEGLQIQRRNGVISAAEWRDLEDMGPSDQPGTEKLIIEHNMTTLEKVGEAPPPAPEAPPSAAEPPPPGAHALADLVAMAEIERMAAEVAHAV